MRVRFDPESGAFSSLFIHKLNDAYSILYLHEDEFYKRGFQASALLVDSGTEIQVDVIKQSKNHFIVKFGNDLPNQRILFTLTGRPSLQNSSI